MLSDIMTIGQKNISSPEQLNSEEYKKILNITLNEWESWKHNNNIIDFVTIHQQGRTHLTGGEPAGTA
jgi:GH15 family glucan-1,4-alpha-glucosidase